MGARLPGGGRSPIDPLVTAFAPGAEPLWAPGTFGYQPSSLLPLLPHSSQVSSPGLVTVETARLDNNGPRNHGCMEEKR